jgi:hypothetical protein
MRKPDAIEGAVAYLERRAARWTQSPTRDFPEWPTPGPLPPKAKDGQDR